MLQVTNLSFDYSQFPVLNRVNFCVPSGKLLHLRGENGSGKTSLLKLISGLLRPSKGEICFQGNPIEKNKASYQQNMCYIGHKPGISLALTPRENCYFDMRRSDSRSVDWASLSLTGLEDVPCRWLSEGQRRRVALLRLFLSDAQLWLLDEPFVSLDVRITALLTQHILDHLNRGGAVIMTSHQPILLNSEAYLEYVL